MGKDSQIDDTKGIFKNLWDWVLSPPLRIPGIWLLIQRNQDSYPRKMGG